MEFAIIETGGKQYRVKKGDTIKIEKLKAPKGDFKEGDSVTFDRVLLSDSGTDTKLGSPMLAGVSVTGKIVTIGRGKKIDVMKYKAKSRYKKVRGHRQPFMTVSIEGIK